MLQQRFSNAHGWLERIFSSSGSWRVLIPPVVLFVAAALAFNASNRLIMAAIGACLGLGGLIVLLRYQSIGIVLLIVASMFVPFSINTGTNTSIHATILLLGLLVAAWIIDMVAIKKEIRLVRSSTTMPLLAFIVVSCIGFISGQINWFTGVEGAPLTAQIGGLSIYLLSAFGFILVAHVIKEPRYLALMTWIFLGLAGFYILVRISPRSIESVLRNMFPMGSDASLFWVWSLALAGAQLFFNKRLPNLTRVMLGVLVAGIIYVGLVENYDWKSGWMPALLGLMVVIWVGAPRFRVLAVLGSLLVILVNFTSVSALLTGQEEYSLSTRTEAWRIVFEIAKVNPITGLGFANYYWYTPLYVIMGYRVSFNSHNNYLDLLAQTGILGLGAFLWFAASIGILGWRLLKQVPDGFHKAYIIGALGGLVGTLAAGMLGDWFLPFVYNVGLVGFRSSVFAWLFLGGLVVYEQLARQARSGVKDATA